MPFKICKNISLNDLNGKYTLLRTSWQVQTKLFFEQSTLHGVRYIAEKGRPFTERLMWFVCVNVSAVAAMIIIVSLWEKFQTNPTITGLDTDFHNWDVAFPAITLCQSMPVNTTAIENYLTRTKTSFSGEEMVEFIIALGQLSYSTFADFKSYTSKNYIEDDAKLKDFIFQFMNPCENIFGNCIWKSEEYNCCDGFVPVFTETGFCYTFNSRHYERKIPWKNYVLPQFEEKFIKETDIKWSLKFDIISNLTDEQIPVYLHDFNEIPTIDAKAQHVWQYSVDKISFSVKETYTTENTQQLTIKQRHCIFDKEVKLSIDPQYTYTACTRQCRMDTSMKLCKCIPHFYPEIGKKYRHCTIKELSCVINHLTSIMSVDKCSCELGCSNAVYEVEKLNDNIETKGLEAEFVSWPMVRYKREVLFGWVDLLVSFGGIAGLFLGFSLLSGVEFLYYFTMRAFCMVKMQKSELKQMETETKKKNTAYDLSLVPSFINQKPKTNYSSNIYRFGNKIQPRPFKIGKEDTLSLSPFGIEYLN